MLVLKRHEGESVVMFDSAGRRRTVTLTNCIRTTRYVNLHVQELGNQFAVTLPPRCRVGIPTSAGFGELVVVVNDESTGKNGGQFSLAFDMPRSVTVLRSELLGTTRAKAVVQ